MTCCQLLLADQSCAISGSIGCDEYGAILTKRAHEASLRLLFHQSNLHPTGHCACLIRGQHRSLVAFLDAALDFRPEHLNATWEAVDAANYLYITGFFLSVSPESVHQILQRRAEGRKSTFVFNLSAAFAIEAFTEHLVRILPVADIVIGNSDEIRALARHHPSLSARQFDSVGAIVAAMTELLPTQTIIVTQGGDAILLVDPTRRAIETIAVPVIPTEEVVDTNGAGDAFVGGLLGAMERGLGLRMAIDVGCFLAGQIIRRPGVQLPTRECVQTHLDTLLLKPAHVK